MRDPGVRRGGFWKGGACGKLTSGSARSGEAHGQRVRRLRWGGRSRGRLWREGEEGKGGGGEDTNRRALFVRGTVRTRAEREALSCGSGLLGRSGKKAGPGRRVLGRLGRKGKRGGGPAGLGRSGSLCWAVRAGRERERDRETGLAGLNGSCRSWWAEVGWVF